MPTRAVREGSAGLLILGGIGILIAISLWLRGFNPGSGSYRAIVTFEQAKGIIVGTIVRYRGVPIGRVTKINQGAKGVDVEIEISSGDLVIPADVTIVTNLSGLIGSAFIDILPQGEVSPEALQNNPRSEQCNPLLVICNNSRVAGASGNSIDDLIQISARLAARLDNKELFDSLQKTAKNTADAAAGVAKLTNSLALLAEDANQELKAVSGSTQLTSESIRQAAGQFGNTATQFSNTANQLSLTASQANNLLIANRNNLVAILDNLSETSAQLKTAATGLNQGELLANLEKLSANSAEASANLRDLTNALNTPTNLVLLQQTLDSARATFQNVQKITSDLDELTGDPTLRQNLRNLINGLSGLVSSTEQLQEQIQLAEQLAPLAPPTNLSQTNLLPEVPANSLPSSLKITQDSQTNSPEAPIVAPQH